MLGSSSRFLANIAAGVLALMASMLSVAGPVTIDYELTALSAPGRYEYRYSVTNVSLATPLNWFSVDFATALYDGSTLSITSFGLGDWSEQILASVPVFGVPAQYDAFKSTGAALGIGEAETGFTVQFTWLGAGTPGAQAFAVYDSTTFDVLASGLTTAVGAPPPPGDVPEPGSAALVLLALCGAAAARARTKRHSGSLTGAARAA